MERGLTKARSMARVWAEGGRQIGAWIRGKQAQSLEFVGCLGGDGQGPVRIMMQSSREGQEWGS